MQIKTNWATFFNGSIPTSKRVSLLQNGTQFAPLIAAQSRSPLAQQSAAKVSTVTLTGPGSAAVQYIVLLAGKPALRNQTGTAVKTAGTWRVSDSSFCKLLSLQGKPPPLCPKG